MQSRPLTNALQLEPGNAAIHYDLGVIYAQQGRYEAGTAAFEQTVTLDTSFAEAYRRLGQIYMELGRYEEAESKLRAALRHRPGARARLRAAGAGVSRAGARLRSRGGPASGDRG